MLRPLRPVYRQDVCIFCRRALSASATKNSGHNKWSKIRHDKAAADAKRNRRNTLIAQDITRVVREGKSGDPNGNPRLASMIESAKKASFPKHLIEAAILRGEGKSSSGKPLEIQTFEVMGQGGVGLIFECETDSKLRALTDIKGMLKKRDFKLAPTQFLFSKRGRIEVSSEKENALEYIMDRAIEAGALDVVEMSPNECIVETEPTDLASVRENLAAFESISVESIELAWAPNEETRARSVDEEQQGEVNALATTLVEYPGIEVVYSNMGDGYLGRLPLES